MRRFRALTVAIFAGTLVACGDGAPSTSSTTTTPPPPPPPVQWTQIWSDEFDGPAGAPVDPAKWTNDVGDGCNQQNCGWGNNEKEYYSADAANISTNGQGQLEIVGRVAPAGLTCYYGACRYTSAKITTRGKLVVQPAGKLEARIKLASGQGLWPAFWMLGSTCPQVPWPNCGEIDIMENKGSQSTTTSSALHGPGYSGATPFAHAQTFSGSAITDYHTYGVEWDSFTVRWFVDGVQHYSVGIGDINAYGASVLDKSFIVILNLAVGGHFDGDPQSDAIFPATMLVDYVRVFQPATH
ncbi:MAG TPA: glycoside hydrolase family 16 protein [Gemmatimonadaceae bacterium]|nr:glycoside hydrolase family 16 protein [Gemmatimonadaceae bacterium]